VRLAAVSDAANGAAAKGVEREVEVELLAPGAETVELFMRRVALALRLHADGTDDDETAVELFAVPPELQGPLRGAGGARGAAAIAAEAAFLSGAVLLSDSALAAAAEAAARSADKTSAPLFIARRGAAKIAVAAPPPNEATPPGVAVEVAVAGTAASGEGSDEADPLPRGVEAWAAREADEEAGPLDSGASITADDVHRLMDEAESALRDSRAARENGRGAHAEPPEQPPLPQQLPPPAPAAPPLERLHLPPQSPARLRPELLLLLRPARQNDISLAVSPARVPTPAAADSPDVSPAGDVASDGSGSPDLLQRAITFDIERSAMRDAATNMLSRHSALVDFASPQPAEHHGRGGGDDSGGNSGGGGSGGGGGGGGADDFALWAQSAARPSPSPSPSPEDASPSSTTSPGSSSPTRFAGRDIAELASGWEVPPPQPSRRVSAAPTPQRIVSALPTPQRLGSAAAAAAAAGAAAATAFSASGGASRIGSGRSTTERSRSPSRASQATGVSSIDGGQAFQRAEQGRARARQAAAATEDEARAVAARRLLGAVAASPAAVASESEQGVFAEAPTVSPVVVMRLSGGIGGSRRKVVPGSLDALLGRGGGGGGGGGAHDSLLLTPSRGALGALAARHANAGAGEPFVPVPRVELLSPPELGALGHQRGSPRALLMPLPRAVIAGGSFAGADADLPPRRKPRAPQAPPQLLERDFIGAGGEDVSRWSPGSNEEEEDAPPAVLSSPRSTFPAAH